MLHTTLPITDRTINDEVIQTVDARTMHEFLQSKRQFGNWIEERIEQYGFVDGKDFLTELLKSSGGRPAKEYHISTSMAKELAMVERNERGKMARQYFIECERIAKQGGLQLEDLHEDQIIFLGFQKLMKKAEALELQLELAKPKVDFYNNFSESDGLYTLQNAGKSIGVAPNKFINWMKGKYLFYQDGNLVPKMQYINQGLFEVKIAMYNNKNRSQSFITPKGVQYFSTRYNENGPVECLEHEEAQS
jgi:anti-repressor protein